MTDHVDGTRPLLRRTAGRWLLPAAIALVSSAQASERLDALVALAIQRHPRALAASQAIVGSEARVGAVKGFWDPSLDVRTGGATRGRAIPGTSASSHWPDEAAGIETGVEMPVAAGLYMGVGAGQYHLFDDTVRDEESDLTQAGVYLAAPLLRDRGFALYDMRHRAAVCELSAAWGRWVQITQDIQRDVELAYWSLQVARAQVEVSRAALERADTLLRQTSAYIDAGAKPAYQRHAASYEVALRREELEAAEQQVESAAILLRESVAEPADARREVDTIDLLETVNHLESVPAVTLEAAAARRGDYLELVALHAAEQARLDEALEERRSDLTLQGSLTWKEHERGDDAFGEGAELSLVWTRPIGFTREQAVIAERRARAEELSELARERALVIRRQLEEAENARRSAQTRLSLAAVAVDRAGEAYAAEEQRFQLGDGTSRQMVDAQKDLTNARRRQLVVLGERLRAETNYRYAAGRLGCLAPNQPRGDHAMKSFLSTLFGEKSNGDEERREESPPDMLAFDDDQFQNREIDLSRLSDTDRTREKRIEKEAEKTVQDAAADSLRRFHVIQRGHCPACGEHLRRHLFAAICTNCGWSSYSTPNSGQVRVHVRGQAEPLVGNACYTVKDGALLVIRDDVVVSRVAGRAVESIDYDWGDGEVQQLHKQVIEQMTLHCGWCGKSADPDADGFHMVQVAFGSTQERYVLCTDECYEAFRQMYPARVHRNCYERSCVVCDLCVKRYPDEAEGMQLLAKDYLSVVRKKANE